MNYILGTVLVEDGGVVKAEIDSLLYWLGLKWKFTLCLRALGAHMCSIFFWGNAWLNTFS